MFSLVTLFLFNALANAQAQDSCIQVVVQRYQSIAPVKLSTEAHRIEVQLETSFWSGNYGLNILVDGQIYAPFGEYAQGGFAFPLNFKTGRGTSAGLGRIHAGMKAYLQAATSEKALVSLDLSQLRADADRFGRCRIDGDSVEQVVAIVKAQPEPVPPPVKPDPSPKPDPAPAPQPPATVGHDQSVTLPEGQNPPGKTLKPDGDR